MSATFGMAAWTAILLGSCAVMFGGPVVLLGAGLVRLVEWLA